uniref:Integrase core domain containing protein n=1 Tax=Solanum tuberosum TaxID=4113 RepID=M1DSX2_SOLTU
MIACLMVRHAIDIARILIFEIHEREFREKTTLPFPCLIIRLVREATVPVLDIDRLVEVTKTVNVGLIWDEAMIGWWRFHLVAYSLTPEVGDTNDDLFATYSTFDEKDRRGFGARQEQTSLPFPVLITELCKRTQVPFRASIDVRITPASSSDIRRIEVAFLWDDAARRNLPQPNTTFVVDPTTFKAEPSTHAPSVDQVGIYFIVPPPYTFYASASSVIPASSSVSTIATMRPTRTLITHISLTQAMIYQMGSLFGSVDVRVTQVKVDMPKIIDRTIENALALLIKSG